MRTSCRSVWVAVTALVLAGCGSGASGDAAHDAAAGDTSRPFDALGADDGPLRDVGLPSDLPAMPDTGVQHDAASTTCPAAALGAQLGRTRLMLGGTMDDTPFGRAPFDVRYVYLSGDVPTPHACASCASGCSVRGTTCANSGGGCQWWGCWQWDMVAPGQYVTDFITHTRTAHAIPMFSYYVWFSVAGNVEAAPEINALTDGARVQRYLADFRFFAQRIGMSAPGPVIVHIEPDLWGFAEQVNQDPTMIPAAVSSAGLSECTALPNTVAGFAQCMLHILRADAPNALAAFHVSAWGAGADGVGTHDPTLDVNAHADRTAAFYRALGADHGDLVVVEMSDRDAGFNHNWWDATNVTFPNFHRGLAWQQRVGQDLGLATLYWQIPYGHTGLPDVCNQYQDNRVEYFFAHPAEFASAGLLGIAFGAGAGCMTTPTTDNGFFVSHAMSYLDSPATRPCLCGASTCP